MAKYQWVICSTCHGSGQAENPAFSNGFTSSEWEHDFDEDEREQYLAGAYDVPCSPCHSSGKVSLPIIASLTFAEKRELVRKRQADEQKWYYNEDAAAERRMGA